MPGFTLAVLVKNEFGVLNRVTSMFRRRRFNIKSLSVSETESDTKSRITIASDGGGRGKNQLIDQLDGMIQVKEVELAEAQQEEESQYEKFKTRVRVMYEQGDTSYLEVLLSSDSISDFLSRYEIVTQIAKYDKDLFEKLKAAKEAVAQKKL